MPLVQLELDEFKWYWNNHRIRGQQKAMPSEHVPSDALEHPEVYDGHSDLLIPVPKEGQINAREYLTEEVGDREEHLSWYTHDFAVAAEEVYTKIGSPAINMETAWTIFDKMSQDLARL